MSVVRTLLFLPAQKLVERQAGVLGGNVVQGNIEGAFDAAVAVDDAVQLGQIAGQIQRVAALQRRGEILAHDEAGIHALAVDGEEGAALAVADVGRRPFAAPLPRSPPPAAGRGK